MSVDTRVRWLARHGFAGAVLRRNARRGRLDARLIVDPLLHAEPYAAYDTIRERGSFSRGTMSLLTARHQVCSEVLRSEHFGVAMDRNRLPPPLRAAVRVASRKPSLGPIDPPSLLAVDPPEHTRYRRLVTRVFTPRAIDALRADVERTASALLDEIGRQPQPVDLVATYASRLPVRMICQVLGVPVELHEQFLRWGEAGAVMLDIGIPYRAFRAAEQAIDELHAWMLGHPGRPSAPAPGHLARPVGGRAAHRDR